jgi:ketosteroid isomerase-like protein
MERLVFLYYIVCYTPPSIYGEYRIILYRGRDPWNIGEDRAMGTAGNKDAILRCIELFNKGTLEWVDTCYSKGMEWIELPKTGTPEGRRGDFGVFRQAASRLLQVFPDRRLRVLTIVAEGDQVALEQEWQGTAAVPLGAFGAGTVLSQRIASFFTLEKGMILRHVDYVPSSR